MAEFALFFSETADIVNSIEWANLKPETGFDGGCQTRSKESRIKQSKTSTGRKQTEEWVEKRISPMRGRKVIIPKTRETIEKQRKSITGKNKGKVHTREVIEKQLQIRRENLIDGCTPKAVIHNYPIQFLIDLIFIKKYSAKFIKNTYSISRQQLIKKLSCHGYDILNQLKENGKATRKNIMIKINL